MSLNSTLSKFTKFKDAIEYPSKIKVGKGLITVFNPGYPLYWKNEILNYKEHSSSMNDFLAKLICLSKSINISHLVNEQEQIFYHYHQMLN